MNEFIFFLHEEISVHGGLLAKNTYSFQKCIIVSRSVPRNVIKNFLRGQAQSRQESSTTVIGSASLLGPIL